MRIALFSDVHANRAALRAVLQAIDREGVDAIFSLGDLVGRGPDPESVVRIIDRRGIESLRGNWDDWIAGGDGWDQRPKRRAHVEAARGLMKKKTAKSLGRNPDKRTLTVEGVRLCLAHGSPRDPLELLVPEMSDERLLAAIEGTDAEIIAVGHSHRAFVRRLGHKLLVNTGTVGYPFDRDPRATFAILEVAKGLSPEARIVHVPYRLERTLASLEGRVREGWIDPEIARAYKLALLGDPNETMDSLSPGDFSSSALVKILAPRIRALYKPWPDFDHRLEAAVELRGALEVARPMLDRTLLSRRMRRLKRLERALVDARVPSTIQAELAQFEFDLVRVFDRLIAQRKESLEAKFTEDRLIDDGLALLALTMRPSGSTSLVEAAARTSARIAKRLARRRIPLAVEEAQRLRRIAAFSRILHGPFPRLGFNGAAMIAGALAEAIEAVAAADALLDFITSPLTARRMKGRDLSRLEARATALSDERWHARMPEIEAKQGELRARFRRIAEHLE